MTVESGALTSGECESNSNLLELFSAPQCNSLNFTESDCNEYIFFSGYEIVIFPKEDNFIDFIYNIGNNMVPYAIAVGEKFNKSISDLYKFVENGKIEKGVLVNGIANRLDPFDYSVSNCGENAFRELHSEQFHTCYTDEEEGDEDQEEDNAIPDTAMIMVYHDLNNEIVKIFNQKCVIYLDNPSNHAFCLCGHQFICEHSFQNKSDVDLLKCVICRT